MPTFNLSEFLHMALVFFIAALKWIGFRVFIMGVLTLILPVVLYNVWALILENTLNIQTNLMGNGGVVDLSQGLTLTGFTAWAATIARIPECFSIIMAALSTRLFIKMLKRF